ncbi:MAG: indolepyruvate ferredoxin oxidoreductase subunit alpha [Methanomicrobiales archaeon]|nr:indolepyruvate ferredoxin oxidoreductase subunit alpha [Methanomicrobiales archaeon]
MSRRYVLGNEAIAHACLEAGVDFVSGYPGTPSSEIIETLIRFKPSFHVEWSVNEKVALENALGASWTGVRTLVTMKHVGLNVAADPLMTSAYTGVKGGCVIVSADDPFAHSSQNEQDSRCYAKFAKLPCLDPCSVQDAHDMLRDAFSLSEELGLPVLFRPTTRICHQKSDVELGEVATEHRKGSFQKNPQQFVVIPAHTRVLHRRLNEKQPLVKETLARRGYFSTDLKGKDAVIASGIAAAYAREILPPGTSFIRIGAYPIDERWLRDVITAHERVLVMEELDPMVEEAVRQVAGSTIVHGKLDGMVPSEGELSLPLTYRALTAAGFINATDVPLAPVPAQGVPVRPPIMCAGCMHRATFFAMKKVFKDGIYPSDIGCYTLGLQLGAVDTCICMGASITIGSGIYHAGETHPIVCTIGDSTFLHTGIPGLMNAVYNGASMVVVILDNRTTAMTGHQPHPATGSTALGGETPPVSLEAICRACGVQYVETVDPYDLPTLTAAFQRAAEYTGVRVVIARQPCVIIARRAGIQRQRYMVDPERCTACGLCVRFGCPAIETTDEITTITDLCSGCGVCAQICPQGAIMREART